MASANHTLLVTGAAGGIGSGFVSEFLKSPHAKTHHGIYVVHPSQPGTLARLLETQAPIEHKYELVTLDLGSLAAIREFAAVIKKRVEAGELPPIRGLFLIAGGIFTSKDAEDGIDYIADGMEKMFAVNYLANFLLVLLLLGSVDEIAGRIVFMSSTTHWPENKSNASHIKKEQHKIVWKEVDVLAKGEQEVVGHGKQERFEAAMRRYGTTKTLMNLFMYGPSPLFPFYVGLIQKELTQHRYELQNRLDEDPNLSKISILAMEPGAVGGTGLFQAHTFPVWMWFILKYIAPAIQIITTWFMPNGFMRTPQQVGKDLVFAGWTEGLQGATYLDGNVVRDSSPETHDVMKQEKLWQGSLKWAGVEDGETVLERWK
jgi:NAD(P)-dependent dehydrogenase (short-subunit alcohol dehydrogenase family)